MVGRQPLLLGWGVASLVSIASRIATTSSWSHPLAVPFAAALDPPTPTRTHDSHQVKGRRKSAVDYGWLDTLDVGYWNLSRDSGERFILHTFRLENIVHNMKKNKVTESPRILFLGDSTDIRVIANSCEFLGCSLMSSHPSLEPSEANGKRNNFSIFKYSNCSSISMGMRFIPGVHQDGPYNQRTHGVPDGRVSSFWVRSLEAKNMFVQYFNALPEMVVIGSNYWDIARLVLYENYTDSPYVGLSPRVMTSFGRNMTLWIRHLKQILPDIPIVYHTHTIPKHTDQGKMRSWKVHQISVDQLNALGMMTARREGVHVVDLRKLSASFTAGALHVDDHHTHDWFNLELLNIYLNILKCAVRQTI
jgi:hypothetical protein